METPICDSGARSTVAQTFARFCAGLECDALPPVAVERAKHFFIDYLAIPLHGSTLDSSRPVRTLTAARPIPGGATLFGRPGPVHPAWAALANGMAAHSMEPDDTFLPGSIHNESFVFSPALALAEEGGASGRRFITAIVAGIEVACRVAAALKPAVTNARGLNAQYPDAWPARVEVKLADGRTFVAATRYARGDQRNPLTVDEVIAKHRSIVAGVIDERADDEILDFVLRLETRRDFNELTRIFKTFVLPG
ncbi:MmgE/PrpD family protein [Paraburkholderia phymatum]|uniref:MmgE/PrpD family protein n=1 Tax=Paraburkholderia phymatum (strain DSM 17167 / CIP 108236 / LMG 21445 / STM815) TaxID=391038 RepID=B2JU21_PARP8|nr:MmgE/PrpD family protein [Paraburkholderia phymatum]ACC76074.1 conserved hypothetical protein [Paraburkholderia phymatum STM815]